MGTGTLPAVPINAHIPDVVGGRGWGYPRWPLLAAILLTPFIIVGYLINLYYDSHDCNFGILCNIDLLPGVVQVLIIWAMYGILWFVSLIFGVIWLEGPASSNILASFLRRISNFEPVRWLLVSYGGLALLGMVIGVFLNRLTPVAFAMVTIVVIVALYACFWRPPIPATEDQSSQAQMQRDARQAGTPGFVLRSLFPFNYLFPNRATPPANAPQAQQAPGQGNLGPPPGP